MFTDPRRKSSIGLVVLLLCTVVACSEQGRPPTSPDPAARPEIVPPAPPPVPPVPPGPPSVATLLWGFVVDANGICIPDATVEIVRGQRIGEIVKQVTPCDAWAHSGGFQFKGLVSDVELTVRASAPGYVAAEKTFTPTNPTVAIGLARIE